MKKTILIFTCCISTSALWAQVVVESPAGTIPGGVAIAATPVPSVYEIPTPVPVSRVLPGQALTGPGFTVAPEADPTGMLYSFHIDTDYGPFDPQSLQMMRVRVAELRAINRLHELSEQPMFLEGVGQQIENTVSATGKAIMSPVKTIKQMPVGLKKFAGDIQAKQVVGKVYGESGSPAYAQIKRELAFKLGVDPYSDNQPLQDLLNEVAKNQNRGQLVGSIGTLVVGGGVGLALNVVEMNDDFQSLIRNKSAAQLQLDNRAALEQLGIPEPVADKFLTTPGYTATNCTAITRALVTLGKVKGITKVLSALPPFAGPESVLFGQTQLQMAAQFNRSQKRLTAVKIVGGSPVWRDAAGTAYIFSPLEDLYWNEEIDLGLSNIRGEVGAGPLEFWITGKATDTATAALASHGVTVKSNAIDRLWSR